MSSTVNQHRSRFGFHRCDYSLFRKLKYLHKHYWNTVRRFHTWHRWIRKEPQNRHGAQPKYCRVFVKNQPWVKPVKTGFKLYPKTVCDRDVLELYRTARIPSPQPVEAFSPEVVAAIESLFEEVQLEVEGLQ